MMRDVGVENCLIFRIIYISSHLQFFPTRSESSIKCRWHVYLKQHVKGEPPEYKKQPEYIAQQQKLQKLQNRSGTGHAVSYGLKKPRQPRKRRRKAKPKYHLHLSDEEGVTPCNEAALASLDVNSLQPRKSTSMIFVLCSIQCMSFEDCSIQESDSNQRAVTAQLLRHT